jgi:hypothetical protein
MKINYVPRILEHLAIYVNEKRTADMNDVAKLRDMLFSAFSELVNRYISKHEKGPLDPEELKIMFKKYAFRENVESANDTQIVLELYELDTAERKYRKAVEGYGMYLSGSTEGYVNAVLNLDEAIALISKICARNNLIVAEDVISFAHLASKNTGDS